MGLMEAWHYLHKILLIHSKVHVIFGIEHLHQRFCQTYKSFYHLGLKCHQCSTCVQGHSRTSITKLHTNTSSSATATAQVYFTAITCGVTPEAFIEFIKESAAVRLDLWFVFSLMHSVLIIHLRNNIFVCESNFNLWSFQMCLFKSLSSINPLSPKLQCLVDSSESPHAHCTVFKTVKPQWAVCDWSDCFSPVLSSLRWVLTSSP